LKRWRNSIFAASHSQRNREEERKDEAEQMEKKDAETLELGLHFSMFFNWVFCLERE
jgi:hypothetical protein